jgi:hypothetical protein
MRRWVVVGAALLAVAGCREQLQPLPELEGGVEMALRRGASWSTLKVRPPYVIGPLVNLHLKKNAFTGTIETRPVNLKIEPGVIRGTGPFGDVSIDIDDGADKTVIEGSWNGQHTHFEITTDAMKGSLPVYAGQSLTAAFYCQYVLDRVDPKDGARLGTSICNGLPEETRLEVPRAVLGWLTRQELVVVLFALLSSPPFTGLEVGG